VETTPTAARTPLPAPTRRPGFDCERWTTTGVQRLVPGDVFALPGESAPRARALVLLDPPHLEAAPDSVHGRAVLRAQRIDTGELVETKLRGNASVTTRCDLYYALHPTQPDA